MPNDMEHLFLCWFAMCLPSLEKYLFQSLAHFLIELFVFVCVCVCYIIKVFSIFWILDPYQIYALQISSPILEVVLSLS